jgi:hypothetical protein
MSHGTGQFLAPRKQVRNDAAACSLSPLVGEKADS